jgi:hypothetical protein
MNYKTCLKKSLHAHNIFFKKIKILHFEKYKTKGQVLRPWKCNCAEYIGVIGHWKANFISFEMSIKQALNLNVWQKLCHFFYCSQKSSGHKAIKFGKNIYVHWDYNLTKNHSNLRRSGCDME